MTRIPVESRAGKVSGIIEERRKTFREPGGKDIKFGRKINPLKAPWTRLDLHHLRREVSSALCQKMHRETLVVPLLPPPPPFPKTWMRVSLPSPSVLDRHLDSLLPLTSANPSIPRFKHLLSTFRVFHDLGNIRGFPGWIYHFRESVGIRASVMRF